MPTSFVPIRDNSLAPDRTLAMGILNITPDSFHDGGAYCDLAAARAQVAKMVQAGADLIDIGGMSSRPGHTVIPVETEISRILPLLQSFSGSLPVPFSVDTDRLLVAEAALAAGVSIINDCSGAVDSELFTLAARAKAPLVVMHRQGKAGAHADICAEVEQFFLAARQSAQRAGVSAEQLIFDPGLGFHKSPGENIQLLHATPRLKALGSPLLIGYSHKRFIAGLGGEAAGAAPHGNAFAAVFSLLAGADIVRIHDVAQFVQLRTITENFCQALAE